MCDCDLCRKQGYLWIVLPAEGFSVVRDNGKLAEYKSSSLNHKARILFTHSHRRIRE
jgi:hypothetical protein